jgi:hypothetical protein
MLAKDIICSDYADWCTLFVSKLIDVGKHSLIVKTQHCAMMRMEWVKRFCHVIFIISNAANIFIHECQKDACTATPIGVTVESTVLSESFVED